MEQQISQQTPQAQQQASPPAAVDKVFNAECLDEHNRCRALHGCPPLTLSQSLAAAAQAWANHLASLGRLQHSTPNPRGSYGENIAMKMVSGSREYKGSQCTAQWYSEIEMYDFHGGENQMNCGHFSQVVWKTTTEAGFGKAIAPDGKMFAVGQYSPPGNFMNKWRANVPPPLSGSTLPPTEEDTTMDHDQQGNSLQKQQPQKQPQQPQKQSQLPLSISESSGGGGGRPAGGSLNQRLLGGGPTAPHSSLPAPAPSDPQEPQPSDPRDRPVGKATKTRIVNGEKTVTVTVTFARPDGNRYQISKETSSHADSLQPQSLPVQAPATRKSAAVALQLPEPEPMIQPARQRRNFAAPPPTAAATDATDGEGDADAAKTFADEVARQHNKLRQRHGAPPLARSDSLDRLAQVWAETLRRSGDLRHSRPVAYGNGQVGQNIAKRPAADADDGGDKEAAKQLVQQWYGERHRFPYGKHDPEDIGGGHFSQVVWCASKSLGVGLAVDKDTGDQYTTCFYYPCGNLVGQFAENVRPILD